MAINAGIHILPVSISGGFEHVQVPVCDIDDGQGKADDLRGDLCFGRIKKGVSKVTPSMSIPCSWMSFTARMLSSPPEKSEMAFTFKIGSAGPPIYHKAVDINFDPC